MSKHKDEINEKEPKRNNKTLVTLLSAAILIICGVVVYNNVAPKEVTVEDFESEPQEEVVIVDRGITEFNEGIKEFVEKNTGVEGLHIYEDKKEGETYALISGKEGMEPLTMMLYGVIDGGKNNMVIGYNYVEASPEFQDEIPLMLLRIENNEEGKEITSQLVSNDDYEDYQEVLKRYEEGENEDDADDLDETAQEYDNEQDLTDLEEEDNE